MKKVVIYPGRFQPMLSHHAKVFDALQQQFPDAEAYIATSDKVDGDKSPFNFQEKQMIAKAHGIDPKRVLQSKSPYNAQSYDFDQDNTVLIFAVGEKDMNRFPFDNVDPQTGLQMTKRGEPRPAYTQHINSMQDDPQPMSKHGYITLAPTIKTGDEVASASAFRASLTNAPDEESAKKLYTQQFGEYNDKVFNLIYDKIVRNKMKEDINLLRQLAGLEPIAEGTPVNFKPGYSMGDEERKLAEIGRVIMDMANERPMGKGVPDSEIEFQNLMSSFGNRLADGTIETKDDLMTFIKSAGENARELADVTKQAMADVAAGKKANVQGDDVPDEEPEDEMMDSVDLSDIRTQYGIDEASDCDETCPPSCPDCHGTGKPGNEMEEASRNILAQIEDIANDFGVYGDCDMNTVNAGAEEVAACYSYSDGSESPDEFYDAVKELLADHGIGEAAEMEEASKPDFLDLDKDGDKEESMKDAAEDAEEEEVDEAVEDTANNAMAAAMAELRKLAGI